MTDEFNPDDHTVPEVVAYLETASPDEFARVKAAEAGGQNRKGIADATQENTDPEALEPSPDGYTRRVVSS